MDTFLDLSNSFYFTASHLSSSANTISLLYGYEFLCIIIYKYNVYNYLNNVSSIVGPIKFIFPYEPYEKKTVIS